MFVKKVIYVESTYVLNVLVSSFGQLNINKIFLANKIVLKMRPNRKEYDLHFKQTKENLDNELNIFMKSFWINNISEELRKNYLKSLWILFKLKNDLRTSNWSFYIERFINLEKNFIESLNFCNLVINSVNSTPKQIEKPRIVHPILKKGLKVLSESS